MKKIALTALIAASLSTGAAVAAEPFKDRGIDYRAAAQPETSVEGDLVSIQANRFNDQGIDYVETVSGSATPRADVDVAVRGFKDRSHVATTIERQDVSGEGEERFGYAR
jgi:hypothetical protein